MLLGGRVTYLVLSTQPPGAGIDGNTFSPLLSKPQSGPEMQHVFLGLVF